MKNNIIYTLLFFSNLIYSQITNGEVHYSLILSNNSVFSSNEFTKEYFKKSVNEAQFVDFQLNFNLTESLFQMNLDTLTKSVNYNAIKSFTGYFGSIYDDKKNTYKLITKMFPENYLLKLDIINNWQISSDFKNINGYKCFKAVCKDSTNNVVVAWYCPEIKSSFGPNGFSGLSGLILEIETNVYKLTSSKLSTNESSTKIKKPLALKEISEKELNVMIDNLMSE